MKFQRLLGVAIAATLAAGVVGVFVKDTTPDMPIAVPTPTPTLTFSETPSATMTPTTEPASPAPSPKPTKTRRPEPEPLPETGVPSQSILGLFALAGVAVLAMERRRAR